MPWARQIEAAPPRQGLRRVEPVSYSSKLFTPNEKVLRSAKRHIIFVLLNAAPYILGALVLWILAGVGYWFDFRYAGALALILLAVSLMPLGIAIYRFMWWRAEQYYVTDMRILQVEGILGKRTHGSSLGQVNDVETLQSVFGRMFDFGDINIITGSDVAINDLHGISQPFEFKKAFLEGKARFHGQGTRSTGWTGQDGASDDPGSTSSGSANVEDTARVLAALTELRNSGVISDAEYQAKLQEVMTSQTT